MVAHFDGIYQEELSGQVDAQTAEISARHRMGRLNRIALQIVTTPSRIRRGKQLQSVALGLFLALPTIIIHGLMGGYIRQFELVHAAILGLLAGAGFACGLGAFLARKLNWRLFGLTVACSIAIGTTFLGVKFYGTLVTSQEAEAKVATQNSVGPLLNKIEDHLSSIFEKGDSKHDLGQESSLLAREIAAANLSYFKLDESQTGRFAYPTQFAYPKDEDYSLAFARTNDLNVAKAGFATFPRWRFEQLRSSRQMDFAHWQDMYERRQWLWLSPFLMCTRVTATCAAIFLFFAFVGYVLGQVKLLGPNLLRRVRVQ
ncbi:MAG: hypothetical protein JST12_14205 [Armatimonadetes bacterium]|nr:hypothetical protein [Armatimonadota bacterium]